MRCEECGKNFIQLGVHLRLKHQIHPDDYRREHNIPLTTALVDESLREHLSDMALQRLKTDEGIEHLRVMNANCDRQKQKGAKRNLPACSIEHCLDNNVKKSSAFREEKLPVIMEDWLSGVSNRDISIKHSVAMVTLRKWVREGHLQRRVLRYEIR